MAVVKIAFNHMEFNQSDIKNLAPEIKTAMGECMLAWGQVETTLSILLAQLLNKNDFANGHIIWDSVTSFRDKIKAINSLMRKRTEFDKNSLELWSILANHITSTYSKRNEIAHSALVVIEGKTVLVPFFSLSDPIKEQKQLTKTDIENHTNEFLKVRHAIDWFVLSIIPHYNNNAKTQIPEPDLFHLLRTRADQSRADKKRHDQSSCS